MTDNFSIPKINVDNENIHKPESENVEVPAHKESIIKKNYTLNKIFVCVGAILLAILLFLTASGILVYKDAKVLAKRVDLLKSSLDSQNVSKVDKELDGLKKDLDVFNKSLSLLGWVKILPFIGGYVSDLQSAAHAGVYLNNAAKITLKTITPYADIIGFTEDQSKKAKSGEDNAKNRIEFIVETIASISPSLEDISKNLNLAKAEVDKINPNRYPENFKGKKVREKIVEGKTLLMEASSLVSDGKPLIKEAPYLLGIEGERTYLVLFQNDKELRPTGGFITAYSIMKVNKGKFDPVSSNDIYNLDNRYKPQVDAPDPIVNYLKGPYLSLQKYRLRDMNWSPDFKESMSLFTSEAAKVGIKDIDGVIAVDTQVVVSLLDVIGKIGVPGFGNFSTEIVKECNCPQVIHELESFADVEGPIVWDPAGTGKIIYKPPHADNRKAIVGPLMNSILANALGQPKDKLPGLVKAFYEALTQKHVLFYLFDQKAQQAVESFNLAGRVKDYQGDYFLINDANLGGRKSNLYVTQEVSQDVKLLKDGTAEKMVTITYNNPQSYDGWLNSVLPNWTRIYVPKGSKLISLDGFEDQGKTYEEFGKTVFSGGFKLRPQGVAKIVLKYKTPPLGKNYKLLVQKQPGIPDPRYTISLGRQVQETLLKSDKEFLFIK